MQEDKELLSQESRPHRSVNKKLQSSKKPQKGFVPGIILGLLIGLFLRRASTKPRRHIIDLS